MTHRPPIIMDNGTGYTKLGYAGTSPPPFPSLIFHSLPLPTFAGNAEPSFVIPSCIALDDSVRSTTSHVTRHTSRVSRHMHHRWVQHRRAQSLLKKVPPPPPIIITIIIIIIMNHHHHHHLHRPY